MTPAERLVLLQGKLRRARDALDLDAFSALQHQIETLIIELDAEEAGRAKSRVLYERAFLMNNLGRYQEAVDLFHMSSVEADSIGDQLRSLIGATRETITAYYGDLRSAEAALRELQNQEQRFSSLEHIPPNDRGFKKAWDHSYSVHLAELAFDVSAETFRRYARDALIQETILKSIGQGDPMISLVRWQLTARLAFIEGAYNDCVTLVATYLGETESDAEIDHRVRQANDIRNVLLSIGEHGAQEYLILARALLRLEGDDHKERARHIIERGLNLEDRRGNRRFLRELREERFLLG